MKGIRRCSDRGGIAPAQSCGGGRRARRERPSRGASGRRRARFRKTSSNPTPESWRMGLPRDCRFPACSPDKACRSARVRPLPCVRRWGSARQFSCSARATRRWKVPSPLNTVFMGNPRLANTTPGKSKKAASTMAPATRQSPDKLGRGTSEGMGRGGVEVMASGGTAQGYRKSAQHPSESSEIVGFGPPRLGEG